MTAEIGAIARTLGSGLGARPARSHAERRHAAEGVTHDADLCLAQPSMERVARIVVAREHLVDDEGDIGHAIGRGLVEGIVRRALSVSGVRRRRDHEAVARQCFHELYGLRVDTVVAVREDEQDLIGKVCDRSFFERNLGLEADGAGERILRVRESVGVASVGRVPDIHRELAIVARFVDGGEGAMTDRKGAQLVGRIQRCAGLRALAAGGEQDESEVQEGQEDSTGRQRHAANLPPSGPRIKRAAANCSQSRCIGCRRARFVALAINHVYSC